MNGAYLAAGVVALLAAAIHGGLGETMVVRKIGAGALPRTRWGGGQTTLRFIRAAWHMVTTAFAAFGSALSMCAVRGQTDACTGVGVLAASSFAGFAGIAITGAVMRESPRALIRHPAPLFLSAVAMLAWLGSRS